MKARQAIAGIGLMVSLWSASAGAIQYEDNNPADVRLDADPVVLGLPNLLYNPSYNGQFDLTGYGYNPATEQIDSAKVSFLLWDAPILGFGEGYTITVEGSSLFAGGNFSGSISLGNDITGSLLGNLDSDGILNYTVTATRGSFWLYNANLTAQASARPGTNQSPVPDGGATISMAGVSLCGLLGLRRKLVKEA